MNPSQLREGFFFHLRPVFLNPGQIVIGKSKGYYCDGNGDVNEFGTGVEVGHVPALGVDFSYTGSCTVIDDSNDADGIQWRIKFLTSGVLKFITEQMIDIFLVGGGGAGGALYQSGSGFVSNFYGGGGGGGYTKTMKQILLSANTSYTITVGSGGDGTSYTAGGSSSVSGVSNGTISGGNAGNSGQYPTAAGGKGGDGGSGGGGGGFSNNIGEGNSGNAGTGGSNGSDGTTGQNGTSSSNVSGAGKGQGITTREFGEPSGTLYSDGGKGGRDNSASNGSSNTGNAGSGGTTVHEFINGQPSSTKKAGSGGSGIVIIRNHRT